MSQRVQVHFHDGHVLLGFKQVDNLAEAETRVALDEDSLVVKVALGHIIKEFLGVLEESRVRQIIEIAAIAPHLLADAHQAIHTLGL